MAQINLNCVSDYLTFVITVTCVMSWTLMTCVYSTVNSSNELDYPEVARFHHFHEAFDERVFGKLNIDVIEVSPSSIHARWRLTNLTHSDSVVESSFLCETVNGRIVSDKLHANTDSFRFEFLNADTAYLICVHLLEKSRSTNTSILHYNCQSFSTIPVIRSDSICALALTMGYFLLSLVLGYLAWYRKARMLKKSEEEKKFTVEDNEGDREDDYCQFVQAAERGGFYSADNDRRGDAGGANGNSGFKSTGSRVDCSGTCVPFGAKEEEELIEYNAKMREISF